MTRQSIKLDEKDRKIITLLHDNQDISQDEIAKIVRLSQPSVAMRIKKLPNKAKQNFKKLIFIVVSYIYYI